MTSRSVFEMVPVADRVAETDLAFAVRDANPVSPGHTLVIPKRPIASWFDATADEVGDAMRLISVIKTQLDESHRPDGYNVGFNDGVAAGQTVFHAHIHVIPRFAGDVADPRGGVRHAVIGKGHY
jgi:diadenosine tetraphosphate (Ap4A) HIT family hydrolase